MSVMQNWMADFDYMRQNLDWGVLTYTCHPYCIGRGHRIMALEKLILYLRENDATFLTMDEAAREFEARSPFPREAALSAHQ